VDARVANLRGNNSRRERHYFCRDIMRVCEQICERAGRSEVGSGRPILWRLKSATIANFEPEGSKSGSK